MSFANRNWVETLAANSKRPVYTFDQRVKFILKRLIQEELGPVYQEICEEAVVIAAKEAKQYIYHHPEGPVKNRLSRFVDSHVMTLVKRIDNGDREMQENHDFLREEF
jgi:hypothetical protein